MSEPRIVLEHPKWARIPALFLMIALSLYFVAAYHFALKPDMPAVLVPGAWSMFTKPDKQHRVIEAEGRIDGAWHPIDLPSLFPYRWESGYRYERPGIHGSPKNLKVFAQATCNRAGPQFESVRFTKVRWPQTPGSFDQPRFDVKTKKLGQYRCRGVR
jgi:hypothetical protein